MDIKGKEEVINLLLNVMLLVLANDSFEFEDFIL